MSANYPAAAFVIMMVTTVLLVPSSAAPAYHGSNSNVEIVDSWWYNTCGHHNILHSESKKLQNRSDMQIYRIVKVQMKLFHDFLTREILHFKEMYAEVQPFDKVERKSFDWLPKYMKPTNRNRSKTVLKDLHAELQYYVVAVNYLKELHLHSNVSFDRMEQRNKTLEKIFNHIKPLICEVESGVNGTGQTVAERVTPDYPLQRGLVTVFENLTEMSLHDTGVIYKLRDFIQKWNNNLMKRLPKNHKRESESEESDTIDTSDENENTIIE